MPHITLSLDTLTTALRWQGIDEPHNVLVAEPSWLSDEARHAADERAWAELVQRGLVRQDVLDARLINAIRVLDRPAAELYGWLTVRTSRVSVLAATAGSLSALVSRNNETVQILALQSADLAQAVGTQLPAAAPGRGRTIIVREADYAGEPQSEGFEGFRRPQDDPDIQTLRRVLSQPRTGGGQLVAARRDRAGTRHRSTATLSYVDTADGRWVTYLSTDHSGQRWVHADPGTPQVLLARMRELLDGVG